MRPRDILKKHGNSALELCEKSKTPLYLVKRYILCDHFGDIHMSYERYVFYFSVIFFTVGVGQVLEVIAVQK